MWQRGEQNRPAQLVEGKKSFILFIIRGLFATSDNGKLLDSPWHNKKKELVRTPLFSVYRAFAHARAFLLNKKWQELILNSDMHIDTGIVVNLSF